jgi:hypothetical protein
LSLVAALAVAGCGGGDGNPSAGAQDDTGPPATTEPANRVGQDTQPLASTLRVEPARLDLGSVSTNKRATGTVRLINSGADPITIEDCKSSCGCTSTNCPKGKELKPGESAEVDIRVTGGSRARTISKTVTFRVVDQQPVVLPVSVQVVAYVTIDPLTITPERAPEGRVVIMAADEQPFRIVSMSPPIIEEFPAEAATAHELSLDWDVWRELGEKRRIDFNIDHPETSRVSLGVKALPILHAEPPIGAPQPEPTAKAAVAVRLGQLDELKKLLAGGIDEAHSNDLLNLAARHGHVEIMAALVEAGANPKAMDKRGRTPLMSAVQSRNAEAVRYLIDNGAEVNARDQLQGTALLRAAGAFGGLETVLVLLSAGAEVNVQDKNGMTPLMWAARWGDVERVEALLKAGAKVTARDETGRTALDWARTQGDKAAGTIAILQPLTP